MIKNLDHSAQKDSETSERMNTSPNKRVIASFERLEEFQMEEGFFLFMKLQRIIFFKDNNSDDEKLNPRRKYNSRLFCRTVQPHWSIHWLPRVVQHVLMMKILRMGKNWGFLANLKPLWIWGIIKNVDKNEFEFNVFFLFI